MIVANHINGLVDALLLMAALPRFPRFLGKSTLFRIVPLWPFLKLAGVVPAYRAMDGEKTSRNESSFRTSRLLLRDGAAGRADEADRWGGGRRPRAWRGSAGRCGRRCSPSRVAVVETARGVLAGGPGPALG